MSQAAPTSVPFGRPAQGHYLHGRQGVDVATVVLLPQLPHTVRIVLDRMPPALFAGLAVQSVLNPSVGLVDYRRLAAAAGAVVVAPLRSLPICLIAGTGAYLLWDLLFSGMPRSNRYVRA